jgi:hypothetical protein
LNDPKSEANTAARAQFRGVWAALTTSARRIVEIVVEEARKGRRKMRAAKAA